MRMKKNNNGFTLVELIIAIAILAFLMTAVSAFMSSGVLSFKKAKADITVHTSAQDVYDSLTDAIMSANDIIIYGYLVDGTMAGTATGELSFSKSGDAAGVNLEGPYYFVRDEKQKDFLKSGQFKYTEKDETTGLDTEKTDSYNLNREYDGAAEVKTYEELSAAAPDAKIYVKKIIIERAKPIDKTTLDASTSYGDGTYYSSNFEVGKAYPILPQQEMMEVHDNTITLSGSKVTSASGDVYIINDTERDIISFNKECMYYETEYAFMDKLDNSYKYDNPSSAFKNTDYTSDSYKSSMSPYTYSESLSYVTVGADPDAGETATGCVATLDVDRGAIQFDLYFSDKNMTYTTLGMVNFRNSYVLKAKK